MFQPVVRVYDIPNNNVAEAITQAALAALDVEPDEPSTEAALPELPVVDIPEFDDEDGWKVRR
jgi:hypothetical protein